VESCPHSGRPGRIYAEIARLGAEFDAAGALVAGIRPDADIAMVYSMPSKWLMQKHPPLAKADGGPGRLGIVRLGTVTPRRAAPAPCRARCGGARTARRR
jgi:hypothetical protein